VWGLEKWGWRPRLTNCATTFCNSRQSARVARPQLAVLSVARCRKLRDSAENKLMSTANFLASALGTAARHSDDGQGIVQRCALVRSRSTGETDSPAEPSREKDSNLRLSRQRLDISPPWNAGEAPNPSRVCCAIAAHRWDISSRPSSPAVRRSPRLPDQSADARHPHNRCRWGSIAAVDTGGLLKVGPRSGCIRSPVNLPRRSCARPLRRPLPAAELHRSALRIAVLNSLSRFRTDIGLRPTLEERLGRNGPRITMVWMIEPNRPRALDPAEDCCELGT